MLIYLLDEVKGKEVQVNLTVDYTLPCSDLYVIFFSTDETCGFGEGQLSQAYNQYQLNKVNHLVGSSLSYEGEMYSLSLGFYFKNNRFIPFILFQEGTDVSRFTLVPDCYDLSYSRQVVFNYPEPPSLLSLEQVPLTFKEVVIKVMSRNKEENIAYAIPATKTFKLDKLVGQEEFSSFLEHQASVFEVS